MEEECFDVSCNMSKEKLYTLLYETIIHKGAITCCFCLGYNYNRKQNSRNKAFFRIKLPVGNKESFEEKTGMELRNPPKVSL